MWSTWPWVTSTATGLSRCSRTTSATPAAASLPGSTTTHSAARPGGRDVAVGAPRTGGESGDQHPRRLARRRRPVRHRCLAGDAAAGSPRKPLTSMVPPARATGCAVDEPTEGPCSDESSVGHEWGRVADDGTVFVRTADGERSVGQYPEGTPEEALKFYTDRYDALAFEVELLEQRIKSGVMSPEEATESVQDRARRRSSTPTPSATWTPCWPGSTRFGDGHRRAARGAQGRARPEAGRGQGREGAHRRRGREARRRHRLAQRRQPAARAARPVEGAPPHRPALRRRPVAAVLDRADGVHQGAASRTSPSSTRSARAPASSRSGWSRRPRRSPTRPSGVRRRASTAT